jgi:hypothetical protein
MSPCETSKRDGLLEHPEEAFADFLHEGVHEVVCEQKHMGSRAVVVVCQNAGAGGPLGKEIHHLRPPQLPSQYNLAPLIDAMNLNYVLCQIYAYGRNLHLGRSPSFVVVGLALATLAHSIAVQIGPDCSSTWYR